MGYEIDSYRILGLSGNATKEQVEEAYEKLCAKYEEARFLPGQEGEDAAEKLQQIRVAYNDIMLSYKTQETAQSSDETYKNIQDAIQADKLNEAQELLDLCNVRDAEWHFLQSVVYFKKNWYLESKKQLEVALQLDPDNERYKSSLAKLTQIISSNTISPDQLRTTSQSTSSGYGGAGNGTCTGSVCGDCCMANMCCDCMRCGMGC